ncbi:MAG TPA: CHAT domain-containing protein, partial [Thermoanaerobaculia bacterium]|nr:CHAT domain-containing protein [Thermoanaerobaculia bacterium]
MAGLGWGLAIACSAPPELPPPEVEYGGCEAVFLPGPVCVLPASRELQVWVAAPPEAEVQIRAGGERIQTAGDLVRDGHRFSLEVPAGAKRVDLLVEVAEGRSRWSLAIEEPAGEGAPEPAAGRAPDRDLIRRVAESARPLYRLIQSRRFTEAREMLEALEPPPGAPAELRAFVVYDQGLLAEKEGDYRSAMARIQRAAEIAERADLHGGRDRWLAEQKLALLFCAVGRYRESAELFERLRRAPRAANTCEMGQFLNNQGWSELLAREAGESLEDPRRSLEEALATYETCEHAQDDERANMLVNLALAHLQEGRLPEAKETLARAREIEPHPPVFQMLWWLDLDARIALGEGRPREALRTFDELGALASETSSFDGRLRAYFGQARARRELGVPAGALEILGEAEALLDEQSLQIPVHQGREAFVAARQAIVSLHVELLLDQGQTARALDVARHARSRVLRQLAHADRLASLPPDRRARWERLVADYQERREALEERARDDWRLPADRLHLEREARRRQAEAAKGLLDQAFLVLAGPQDRPSETPALQPRPGELTLVYHPLAGGWVGFAVDELGATAHRFALPPGTLARRAEVARRLLLPFQARIERAERLRILATGLLQNVDFHVLPWDGDVLLASVPVAYGLDLPVPLEGVRSPGRRALLVADPRDDLPGSVEEIRAARAFLESGDRRWIVEELRERKASAAAVWRRLPTADLFHYAGHGTFEGLAAWESSLLLARETRLTTGDVLALEQAPGRIILSACETGRSTAATPVATFGLAQAFLL